MASQENQRAHSILTEHVKKSYQNREYDEAWRNLPEVPTGAEIMPKGKEYRDFELEPEAWDAYQKEPIYDPDLPHNIVNGPWPSKEEYIGAHYQIAREDAIAGLRLAVAKVKRREAMMDDKDTCIYTHVTFKGLLLSRIGAAFRVEFSTERAAKQIRWEQSKRLVAGTIVALTPHRDMFRQICKIAVVAARPIEGGLDQNPPQIDLFWGDLDDAVFDPVQQYVMVESRSGYFESSRHMLVAMQKLMTEKFNLSNHIVSLDIDIKAPEFTKDHPWMNLNSLVRPEVEVAERKDGTTHDEDALNNVDVLNTWPDIPHTGMDLSQRQACEAMLTKRIAIVQGPPGTGKTFVSVSALQVMVENWEPGNPPIIIAAQTNHALDQLLTHVMNFEPNIVRLGSRCDRENLAIIQRTLFELRRSSEKVPRTGASLGAARREWQVRVAEIKSTLATILSDKILTTDVFLAHGIITKVQVDSLFEEGWAGTNDQKEDDIADWLTEDQLMLIPGAPPINQGLPLEESDIEFEQLQELELEMTGEAQESKDKEGLSGEWLPFKRQWTGKHASVSALKMGKFLSKKKNLYEIPKAQRGQVYRSWEKELNEKILKDLKAHLKAYKETSDNYQITKWLANIALVRQLGIKVIGCTTTGLSKYRGLLAALEPRTMLIEEAAETLEGTIIAGMVDSLEQLILVGDHQQLQAHCNVRALESPPYNLNVSMFERLVNNHIGYVMLNRQRRMITDVRELLTMSPKPFYRDLYDHDTVMDRKVNRPPVPGMGGKDTWFFHHNWPEARNADLSKYNKDEAEMIAGFYNYLVLNGVDNSKITVLTFYNGQRKTILQELRRTPGLESSTYFRVHTVDSYQGEENDVILLSLVRSNQNMGIGFLDNKNRLVVALSRARRGLYIFGNSVTLTANEEDGSYLGREQLWDPLITFMKCKLRYNLDGGLPITCKKHRKTTLIQDPEDWQGNAGGCKLNCSESLPCGHPCPYRCHPFDHESVVCQVACPRKVPGCGHGCSGKCGERCYCNACRLTEPRAFNTEPDAGEIEYYSNNNFARDVLHGSPTKSASGGLQNDRRRRRENVSQSIKRNQLAISDIRNETVYTGASSPMRSFSGPSGQKNFVRLNPHTKFTGNNTSGQPANKIQPPSYRSPAPGLNAWQKWDAKKSDKELMERLAREEAARTPVDLSKLVYKETFRSVKFTEDGKRVMNPKGNVTSLVPRFDKGLAKEDLNPKKLSEELSKEIDNMNLSTNLLGGIPALSASGYTDSFPLDSSMTQAVDEMRSVAFLSDRQPFPDDDYPVHGERRRSKNTSQKSPGKTATTLELRSTNHIRGLSHAKKEKLNEPEDLINFN